MTVSAHDPPPRLCLNSLPSKVTNYNDPPGLLTPPIHTLASVPFQWEEAPGKPRPCCYNKTTANTQQKPKASRCLELPPRLLNVEATKVANFPSPTTVLDGPDVVENLRRSVSGKDRFVWRSSSGRWGSFRRKKHNSEVSDAAASLASSVFNVSSDDQFHGGTKVRITKIKRRSSFFEFSKSRSQLLTSIYEGFRQVVPWKRSTKRS